MHYPFPVETGISNPAAVGACGNVAEGTVAFDGQMRQSGQLVDQFEFRIDRIKFQQSFDGRDRHRAARSQPVFFPAGIVQLALHGQMEIG
ncbi:hypothetical protein SDC9_141370 [bioreactor metagenome]|uniref:Uncharacterized protein n=1 Tax=bioreactor metagenome TaxID=1076179 RepID=A0A645DY35_9ZZZZ